MIQITAIPSGIAVLCAFSRMRSAFAQTACLHFDEGAPPINPKANPMRKFTFAMLCAIAVLPGCASREPVAPKAPIAKPEPVAVGKSNRFEMTQNGRRMSANDFDAWMKARGIRVAKGKPQPKPKPKGQPKR